MGRQRPGKPCIGCAAEGRITIVHNDTSWCVKHEPQHRRAYRHPDYVALRNKLVAAARTNKPIICAYCKQAPATQPDHAVALAHGGPHDKRNLVPSCARCNQSKNAGGHDG